MVKVHVLRFTWKGMKGTPAEKVYSKSSVPMVMVMLEWVASLVCILQEKSGKWLDCNQTAYRKSSCAGVANYEHGFDTRKKWYSCYGSVFKIYAQGTLKNGMYSVVIKIETILYFMYHAIIHCLPSFIFYKSILSYGYLSWSC